MKILFVINPVSGAGNNEEAILQIHETALQKGFDFKFLYTTGEMDDEAIQDQIKEYEPDKVIAGGGDGTVLLVVRNLLHKNIPIGILPMGSANGLATALDISNDYQEIMEYITDYDKTIPFDVLKINDEHICVHLGDIGMNALLIKKYSEMNERGMSGYAKHVITSMKETPILNYTIIADEKEYKKEGYMLCFANANKYGTGIHISEGNVSDGKFEIINVPDISVIEILKKSLTKFNVFLDDEMFSEVISTKIAEIKINQKVHWQIDGEYMGETDYLKIEIIPSAIKLLVK